MRRIFTCWKQKMCRVFIVWLYLIAKSQTNLLLLLMRYIELRWWKKDSKKQQRQLASACLWHISTYHMLCSDDVMCCVVCAMLRCVLCVWPFHATSSTISTFIPNKILIYKHDKSCCWSFVCVCDSKMVRNVARAHTHQSVQLKPILQPNGFEIESSLKCLHPIIKR